MNRLSEFLRSPEALLPSFVMFYSESKLNRYWLFLSTWIVTTQCTNQWEWELCFQYEWMSGPAGVTAVHWEITMFSAQKSAIKLYAPTSGHSLRQKGWVNHRASYRLQKLLILVFPCYGLDAYKGIFIYCVLTNSAQRFWEFHLNLNRKCTVNSAMSVGEFPEIEDDTWSNRSRLSVSLNGTLLTSAVEQMKDVHRSFKLHDWVFWLLVSNPGVACPT